MVILDLSTFLANGMVQYPSPYMPKVQIKSVATHEKEARSAQSVTFGTHVATHIDAPFHAIPQGNTVDRIPLSQLVGPARILRFAARDKTSPLDVQEFEAMENLERCEKLILDTGWARQTWGSQEYFTEGPFLTPAATRYLADLPKLHLLGMDFPNIDSKDNMVIGKSAPNHLILLGRDIVLLENLLRLDEVDEWFFLSAAPPKLKGGDGCPCRAVAVFPLNELASLGKILP
ncbi:MAG: cyclase family protein [Nitrospinales bacterium]